MCLLMCVPAGVPNEAELLNPVGAIPHSGDSAWTKWWVELVATGYLVVYMQNMPSIFIALVHYMHSWWNVCTSLNCIQACNIVCMTQFCDGCLHSGAPLIGFTICINYSI